MPGAASVLLWGPPGTGKTTLAYLVAGGRRFIEVSAVIGGRQGRAGDHRRLEAPGGDRRTGDGRVHRRGAPLHQDPAGRAASRRREPLDHARRRDHGEPVVLRHRPAAVALDPRHAPPARRGGDPHAPRARGRRRARPRGAGRGRGRRARAHRARRGRRRAQGSDAAGEPRRRGGGGGPGDGGARRAGDGRRAGRVRPAGRPALRRHQRVHQVRAGVRRRRRAALFGAHGRGGGGPALHRAAPRHPRRRGRGDGGPPGARDRPGRRRRRELHRHARGAHRPRRGDGVPRDRAQVEPLLPRPRRRHRGRQGRAVRRRPRAPARRPRCARPGRRLGRLGHVGYQYAHDAPHAVAAQDYLPDALAGAEYYEPTERGYERDVASRLAKIRDMLGRGKSRQ